MRLQDCRVLVPEPLCLSEVIPSQDLPRTFPGHPALDSIGRDSLRRLLTAYARKEPKVGYCQGMNFLGGLLLLLMPEENAFWTLSGIIDDYLAGYYSDDMIEAQVGSNRHCYKDCFLKT